MVIIKSEEMKTKLIEFYLNFLNDHGNFASYCEKHNLTAYEANIILNAGKKLSEQN